MRILFFGLLVGCFVLTSCSNSERSEPIPLFESLDAGSLGIDFENTLTYTEDFNVYLYRSFYNGAGCGLADFNDDGFLDLFFIGNQVDNKLYLGDGNFNFKDVTDQAGVASADSWSTGVSVVDINQDGKLDIYVCKSGNPEDKNRRNELFINTGTFPEGIPRFVESAAAYGLDNLGFSVHAQFLDYDKDGDLDMYLSNNSINPTAMILDVKRGMRDKRDEGGGNKLYRNDKNVFTDVSAEAGIYSSAIGFGLGIAVGDVNRDNWPDIYVANDFFEKDYLYINNRDGTFTESIEEATNELSLGAMGVDIADIDNNGFPDIYVTEMLPKDEARLKTKAAFDNWDQYSLKVNNGYHRQFPRNSLQINRASDFNGREVAFSEISRYSGVAATDWSWGVQMVDFDLDGQKEIFVTNGIVKDLLDQDYIDFYSDPATINRILMEKGAVIKELIDKIPSQPISNCMFRHQGNYKFTDVAAEWGMNQPGFSSGSAYGDIDNDGDLDLVVSNINSPPLIYRNRAKNDNNHFLSLSLKTAEGTDAIGAQATIYTNGKLNFMELYPMRGVMSAVDSRLNFGLGSNTKIDSVRITWPDGSEQLHRKSCIDCFPTYSMENKMGSVAVAQGKLHGPLLTEDTQLFTEAPAHVENNFVDFDREKLLFQMISNEGPKLAIGDVDRNGLEDFYLGGAKDKPGSLYVQAAHGFQRREIPVFEMDKASEDTGVLFFDADQDQDLDLLVSSGGYEFSSTSFALYDRLYFNDGKGNFEKSPQNLPGFKPSSTSVIINADIDSDGDQDLFFGGRTVPSSYGVPVSSRLLRNDGKGYFTDVTQAIAPDLLDIGMVTDAVWTDFDNDGDPDLAMVGEWMPVVLIENENGHFKRTNTDVGLSHTQGLWNVLEMTDLDGDGRQDLIAGNLGENTFFGASVDKPVKMYVNDFDQNGQIEQVLTRYNGTLAYPFAMKKQLTSQMPYLLKKYLKHADYSEATIDNIFTAGQLEQAITYELVQSKSVILWNEGGTYTVQDLPFEAQLYPIYGIHCTDLDEDGLPDIVLGGNQFNAQPQTGIYGAGYGTVLMGDGKRQFTPLGIAESGFLVRGQIRDIKELIVAGKRQLLIAINNDRLKTYEISGNGK